MPRQRPPSIIAIAALKVVDGVLGLASGCALLAGSGALSALLAHFYPTAPAWLSGALGGVLAVIGLGLILFALLDLILAWCVWKLYRWAWWLTMIVAVLSVVGPLITLIGGNLTSIPSIAINGIVITLLLAQQVRQAMGSSNATGLHHG